MAKQDRRHIVTFSAEAAPYIKVGGLADVVGALPKMLEKLGAQVTVVLPAYQVIAREQFGIHPSATVPPFDILVGSDAVRVEVAQTAMPGTGVEVFFLGGGGYFSRAGVYDDPVTKEGYPDNMQRLAFYAKAGLELLLRLGQPVDVVHCHDSQTALIPGLLRTVHLNDPFYRQTGCLFTIHNLAYQGLYPKEALRWARIDPRHFSTPSPFEFWGKVNFMKIGIETADLVNTVSETYAKEIQSGPEYGSGLEGVLKMRAKDLYGIVNGIDYDEWNPETDPLIAARYSTQDLSGKARCKAALLQAMRLPQQKGRVPLIGIISRLADQKGFDLIGDAIEEIAAADLQMVVLGTGQIKYHELFENISSRYPRKIAVKLGFDNQLAHQIEAGADMFLMPSKYEPCGLNQLYSLRYGTVPIVRSTGGLADTITDYNLQSDSGTGFVFRDYTAAEMMTTIERALVVFADSERWRRLVVRDMLQRWSWEESARKYMQLYEKIYRRRHA
ncbi:MAG: glycogen synthase GlgA [Acidobacteriia bacterium]|nr:glycogen synthase GlgA [Terriglobia bacterium]